MGQVTVDAFVGSRRRDRDSENSPVIVSDGSLGGRSDVQV
jgi:hypothetical protein